MLRVTLLVLLTVITFDVANAATSPNFNRRDHEGRHHERFERRRRHHDRFDRHHYLKHEHYPNYRR
ncbi:MAG: hypothetical protein ACRYFA_01100 [Janthinobacterium lividum]